MLNGTIPQIPKKVNRSHKHGIEIHYSTTYFKFSENYLMKKIGNQADITYYMEPIYNDPILQQTHHTNGPHKNNTQRNSGGNLNKHHMHHLQRNENMNRK